MIHQQFYLTGIVQGVGFRPFVYRLATDLNLKGWVQNSSEGVTIAVEGKAETIAEFSRRLWLEKPLLSDFKLVEQVAKPCAGFEAFEIRPSAKGSTKRALVLPDLATCPACLRDVFDPQNRRYHYAFTNCTYCGPRHSILLNLPYDRGHTTMRHFPMCADCQQEYDNPRDRRFHAQPNACPTCGPQLTFSRSGAPSSSSLPESSGDPLHLTVEAIGAGEIVAIKGIGGFHLVCDATNEQAVQTLRERKARLHKPFALMVKDLAAAQQYCQISPVEADLLSAPQAPIVLLTRLLTRHLEKKVEEQYLAPIAPAIASSVAPDNPNLGVMLPYSPLHHLLMQRLAMPIVATSGNRSDEPICIDNEEALQHLDSIADAFLLHDRPIACPLDDSIVRVVDGQIMMMRRSRGYAPLPLPLPAPQSFSQTSAPTILAVGGHLKNTIAFTRDDQIFLSPHLGDLDSVETLNRFETTIAQACQLYDLRPQIIVRDAHPDYASSQFAEQWVQSFPPDSPSPPKSVPSSKIVSLQHHQAHFLACWGEHPVQKPALGVIWDGTGLGTDGQIWGGEFFELRPPSKGQTKLQIRRVAHLRPFPLLGGDRAAREPRRSALGLLYSAFGAQIWDWTHLAPIQSCSPQERKIFEKMLQNHLNVPLTSSMGRLFDGVAAILGLFQEISFEGQAAQALEYLLPHNGELADIHSAYPLPLQPTIGSGDLRELNWHPLIQAVLTDLEAGRSLSAITTAFHQALVAGILTVANTLGHSDVYLSGGCFQNLHLLQQTILQLRQTNFTPHWPQQVPPNDGGIAFGQAIGALLRQE
ncbi:MAG: carbamoyltransferase HypF [Prochlorotrichaceae cyanobacterium]|jgi:hydrogenase maturation protein HypF